MLSVKSIWLPIKSFVFVRRLSITNKWCNANPAVKNLLSIFLDDWFHYGCIKKKPKELSKDKQYVCDGCKTWIEKR
jgi:hypothetical protein